MKAIRESVWETNSSSTHSISISSSSDIYDTIYPDKDGIIYLKGGEFGWEWETYTSPIDKANYCVADNLDNQIHLDMLKKVIKDHTGAKEVVILASDGYRSEYHSYVDHQSSGTSFDAFKSEETLKQFLFSPGSYLQTGNDNS